MRKIVMTAVGIFLVAATAGGAAYDVAATADGSAVAKPFVFRGADRATKRQASRVTVGGITLQEHRSGQRVAIRPSDPLAQNRLKIAVTAGEKLYKSAERTTAAR